MRRHGVEMSMSLIIVIVLGLVLLAILIYVLATKTNLFGKSISSCQEKGGTCKSECDRARESGSSFFSGGCSEGDICCIPQELEQG
jgi:hypothetical protein